MPSETAGEIKHVQFLKANAVILKEDLQTRNVRAFSLSEFVDVAFVKADGAFCILLQNDLTFVMLEATQCIDAFRAQELSDAEKPDVLWERPQLERLYARLEDEYELKERADVLTRKLTVISDTAKALADIIDTERSLRLELIIVILILFEILIAAYQILWLHK